MQADPAWSVHGHERNGFAWCRKGDGPVAHLPAASVAVTTPGANAAFTPPAISRSAQPCGGGGICRLCPYSRRRRCPPSPSARGKAPLERRPVAAQAGICAAQSVKEISLKHRLRWAKLRPSDGSVQPAPESFAPCPVKQFRLATLGRPQDRLPKSDTPAPRIGQNGLA
jgi:hypothetical protein